MGSIFSSQARIFYVTTEGDDEHNGQSWEQAKRNPQAALDAALPGDELWIAQGCYAATSIRPIQGETLFASSFILKDGVSIYGGFCGKEHTKEERQRRSAAAWDFAYETQLTPAEETPGNVLYGGYVPFEHPTIINGLTLCKGNAQGAAWDGCGGGALLSGNCCLSQCIVCENTARHGGGVTLVGKATVQQCKICRNELISKEWGGQGGGIQCLEDNGKITNCLIVGNGTSKPPTSGGGIYTSGSTSIDFCTIVQNQASRQGSGIVATRHAVIRNSVLWNNRGTVIQLQAPKASISHCAIEGGAPQEDTIILESSNAGIGGKERNDNRVDGYYPCFNAPEAGDFTLASGSYLINRGMGTSLEQDANLGSRCQWLVPDIGAFESSCQGNLAIDFELEFPCIYGEQSHFSPLCGALSPESLRYKMTSVLGTFPEQWTEGEGRVTWQKAGRATLTMTAAVQGAQAEAWKEAVFLRTLEVSPRPILIMAEDLECFGNSPWPQATWQLIAGSLVNKDTIQGTLEILQTPRCSQGPNSFPIVLGTLAVQDQNNGHNYHLMFMEGELIVNTAEGETPSVSLKTDAGADY